MTPPPGVALTQMLNKITQANTMGLTYCFTGKFVSSFSAPVTNLPIDTGVINPLPPPGAANYHRQIFKAYGTSELNRQRRQRQTNANRMPIQRRFSGGVTAGGGGDGRRRSGHRGRNATLHHRFKATSRRRRNLAFKMGRLLPADEVIPR